MMKCTISQSCSDFSKSLKTRIYAVIQKLRKNWLKSHLMTLKKEADSIEQCRLRLNILILEKKLSSNSMLSLTS